MHAGRRFIEMLAEEWTTIEKLCSSLTEEQWDLQTDLPGWSVKDTLSHVVGTESILLGRSAAHKVDAPPHVRNPLGELNEVEVDYRRGRSGPAVLDELREVTAERLEGLRAISDGELDRETWTPIGIRTTAVFLETRVLDCWAHEQDIRRAVDQPGHLEGQIPQHVFRMMSRGIPKSVAKDAGTPDGSVVVFDVEGIDEGTFAVGVQGKRGGTLDEVPSNAAVQLGMDFQTYICLTLGRWDPARILKSGRIDIQGDRELGTLIAMNMNGMM